MTITPDYAGLCAEITAEFPKFTIAKKSDSWLMKAIGFFLGSQFMSSYVTTIVNTVYVPDGWDTEADASKCAVLRHERVHMRQAKKLTFPVFAFLYMFVFLPMFLSYFRAKFEMEAYTESLQAFKDYGIDYSSDARRQWLLTQFVTGAYGWMWPFSGTVSGWFDAAVASLH